MSSNDLAISADEIALLERTYTDDELRGRMRLILDIPEQDDQKYVKLVPNGELLHRYSLYLTAQDKKQATQ